MERVTPFKMLGYHKCIRNYLWARVRAEISRETETSIIGKLLMPVLKAVFIHCDMIPESIKDIPLCVKQLRRKTLISHHFLLLPILKQENLLPQYRGGGISWLVLASHIGAERWSHSCLHITHRFSAEGAFQEACAVLSGTKGSPGGVKRVI